MCSIITKKVHLPQWLFETFRNLVLVFKTFWETTEKSIRNCIENNRNASKISIDLHLMYRKDSLAFNHVCKLLVWTCVFKVHKFKSAAHTKVRTYPKGWLDQTRSFVQQNKEDLLLFPPRFTEQIKWTRTLVNNTHKWQC